MNVAMMLNLLGMQHPTTPNHNKFKKNDDTATFSELLLASIASHTLKKGNEEGILSSSTLTFEEWNSEMREGLATLSTFPQTLASREEDIEEAPLLEFTEIAIKKQNKGEEIPYSDGVSAERVLQELDDFFYNIPFSLGFVSEEVLKEHEITNEVLATLPNTITDEVKNILQQNVPFEQIISKVQDLVNPAKVMAVLLGITRVYSVNHELVPTRFMELLNQSIEQVLPIKGKLEGTTPLQTLESLKQLLETSLVKEQLLPLKKEVKVSIHQLSGEQPKGIQIGAGELNQPLAKSQQLTIHVGEQKTTHASQQEFGRQFENMLQKGILRNLGNGVNQFSIKLFPQHLGRLDIQLVQQNGIITAKITASNGMAKELIEGQLNLLRNAFTQQQLNVERIEVLQQQQQNSLNKEDEQQKEQKNPKEQQGKQEENELEEQEAFTSMLEEQLINVKV